MIHARTIDCLVQHSDDVTQAEIDLKWYWSGGHFGQFLTLFPWRCRPIYTSCMGSPENRQVIVLCHMWTESSPRAERCEPVWVRHYTRGFSVDTKW